MALFFLSFLIFQVIQVYYCYATSLSDFFSVKSLPRSPSYPRTRGLSGERLSSLCDGGDGAPLS